MVVQGQKSAIRECTAAEKKSLNRSVQAKKKPWTGVSVHGELFGRAVFRKQPVANELSSSPPLPRHVGAFVYPAKSLLRVYASSD
jgi:hypothetical protein